jgi:hypothetical protein
LLESFQWGSLAFGKRAHSVFKTVIDVILNQRALGLAHRFLDRMKLLGDVYTLAAFFDHGDDASQVSIRTLKAFDNRIVGLMRVGMCVFVITHCLSL